MSHSSKNTIVVATDYSPSAQNAAVYALHLAKAFNAHLELVHAYVIPFTYTDNPLPLVNIDDIQDIATTSMQAELNRLRPLEASVSIGSKIFPGDVTDFLAEMIEEEKPLLIVMGTSGSGSGSILWGSMAVKALRSLKAPVLVVPQTAQWEPVTKLYFAADYLQISDKTPAAEIVSWVKRLGAGLDVVHISKKNEGSAPPSLLVELLAEAVPQYHTIIEDNVETGVAQFLERNGVGWLLVIPRKYGFLENIFRKSRTKLLTQISDIPILALHQE